MKRLSVTFIILLLIISVKAQNKYKLKNPIADTTIYVSVEQPPEFPGGDGGFLKYIAKNLRYPSQAQSIGELPGRVLVQFVIEKDGTLSNIKVIKPLSPTLDEAIAKVLNNSPRWKPGIQGDRTVRVKYIIPLEVEIDQ